VAYQVYDVTGSVTEGKNAIAAYLAPGWYATPLQGSQEPYNYGNSPPALRAQLRIEHNDGSVEWVNTDESWKADVSPIEKAEIYDGESYDARREQRGWNTAQFSDAAWKSAQAIQPNEPEINAQDYPPIRVEMELHAKSVTEPKPGVYVLDFGQNMAAIPALRVQCHAGTTIRLRFVEVLIRTARSIRRTCARHWRAMSTRCREREWKSTSPIYVSRIPVCGDFRAAIKGLGGYRNRASDPYSCTVRAGGPSHHCG
jgi:hypothetical protein